MRFGQWYCWCFATFIRSIFMVFIFYFFKNSCLIAQKVQRKVPRLGIIPRRLCQWLSNDKKGPTKHCRISVLLCNEIAVAVSCKLKQVKTRYMDDKSEKYDQNQTYAFHLSQLVTICLGLKSSGKTLFTTIYQKCNFYKLSLWNLC